MCNIKKIYYIVDDALRFGGIGNWLSKSLITKRLRSLVVSSLGPDSTVKRTDVNVYIHDSMTDADKSVLDFVGGVLQKLHGRRVLFTSVHHLLAQSGKVVIVVITE